MGIPAGGNSAPVGILAGGKLLVSEFVKKPLIEFKEPIFVLGVRIL